MRNIFVYPISVGFTLKKYIFTSQCSLAGSSNLLSFWHKTVMLLQFLVFLATLKGSLEVTSISNYHYQALF